MGRGVDEASVRALFAEGEHDAAFVERVLAIPGERRGQPRRNVAEPVDDAVVSLGADDMATLHRLRFESETGMHRLTMADCPADFTRFGLVHEECDGTPTITVRGRQALKHFACVRALDGVARGLDVIPMSDDIKSWLETQCYLHRIGSGYAVTELGQRWLAFNAPVSQKQTLS